MEINRYIMGPVQTNTYLLKEGDDVLLIDPASKPEKLIELVGDSNLVGILLTHGHFDHLKAVDGLYARYHCPVYLHEADEAMARDKDSGAVFGLCAYISCPVLYLKEGRMQIGPFDFETIFTPGHTPGSVIFVFEDAIFTGDTLFAGSIGRTDLAGGNGAKMRESLRVFKTFSRDYDIYPGHEETTTLYHELEYNWYLN